MRFQSTRPVWGATPIWENINRAKEISIHAPRVGRDHKLKGMGVDIEDFNPRAPCGARHRKGGTTPSHRGFQSTRPVWGATPGAVIVRVASNISIHAPRVGRDLQLQPPPMYGGGISIHAPRVGRDRRQLVDGVDCRRFQSTRPVWGATVFDIQDTHKVKFQSTRPVWGATLPQPRPQGMRPNFNPRAPCGARQQI